MAFKDIVPKSAALRSLGLANKLGHQPHTGEAMGFEFSAISRHENFERALIREFGGIVKYIAAWFDLNKDFFEYSIEVHEDLSKLPDSEYVIRATQNGQTFEIHLPAHAVDSFIENQCFQTYILSEAAMRLEHLIKRTP